MLLCNGAQQGLHLAFATLRDTSDIILTESATFPGALAAAANLGMTMAPVAHDGEGMLPEALDAALTATGARIIYTTPVCQNPLGFETGPERRRAIAKVVARHGAVHRRGRHLWALCGQGKPDLSGAAAGPGDLCHQPLQEPDAAGAAGGDRAAAGADGGRAQAAAGGKLGAAALCGGAGGGDAGDSAWARRRRLRCAAEAPGAGGTDADDLGIGAVPMPGGAPHLWLPMAPLKAEQFARRASEAGVRITPPSAVQVGEAPVAGCGSASWRRPRGSCWSGGWACWRESWAATRTSLSEHVRRLKLMSGGVAMWWQRT